MHPKKIAILSVAVSVVCHLLVLSLTGLLDMQGSAANKDTFTVDLKESRETTDGTPPQEAPSPAVPAVQVQVKNVLFIPESGEDTVNLNSADTRSSPYLKRLRDRIARVWAYPTEALTRKEEGTTVVRFSLSKSGALMDLYTVRSSGARSVDKGALSAVRSAAPYDPLPQNLTKLHIIATFRCRLTD